MKDIVINSVYKSFGGRTVLSGFSAVIKAGRFNTLMGKSGCGKTTLANIIMGLIPPDTGEVSNVPERISAVFQENRLSENFNAVSNIFLVTGRKFPKETIIRCLNNLGLEENLDKPVRDLSGGMRRRVAIARALLAEYELLILDEPFKELDANTKDKVMEYVKNSAAGKTVLLITHSREEAEFFGGDIIEM
ncbi:MAG: ATP-binding cassette domain-containing protein [Clostridiales bacterium]|nr:ATP-binding cassette domain-containing protein [Clostridiales bacterium]